MKSKFEILRETLDEFAQQDEFPALVVGCRGEDLAYVLQFLQALEQSLPSHLVVVLSAPFTNAGAWLDAIVEIVRVQLEFAAPTRAERGEPPAPPLPPTITDPSAPAHTRLVALLMYLAALLPPGDGFRIVVGLTPLECDDVRAFATLMTAAMPHPEPPAWMERLRVVAWDEHPTDLLADELRRWPAERVLYYREDFSTPALTDALGREAADRNLDLDQRMGALMQLAAIDFAYGRHTDAVDKYALLHQHYFETQQPALQALALLGAGDTLHGAGASPAAKLRLQQGIAVAMEAKSLAVLVPLLLSVCTVCLSLGHFAEAESYADSGSKVAAAAINPFAYCDFFARRGDAQVGLGELGEAIVSYDKAREQCQVNEHYDTWLAALDSEIRIYADAGRVEDQRALERERDLVVARQRSSPRQGAST